MFLLRKFRMKFILGVGCVSEDILRRALEGIGEDIELSRSGGRLVFPGNLACTFLWGPMIRNWYSTFVLNTGG